MSKLINSYSKGRVYGVQMLPLNWQYYSSIEYFGGEPIDEWVKSWNYLPYIVWFEKILGAHRLTPGAGSCILRRQRSSHMTWFYFTYYMPIFLGYLDATAVHIIGWYICNLIKLVHWTISFLQFSFHRAKVSLLKWPWGGGGNNRWNNVR